MPECDSILRDPFDEIYHDVPAERRNCSRRFRATHPLKRLTVEDATWAYIAAGQGAHALLILGGAMSTAETSFRHIERYEGQYRIVSPSYPPLGRLAPAPDGLAGILDAEGIARAHVFGHSLGAGIAHAFIRRYPERVEKLVLSGFGSCTSSKRVATSRALHGRTSSRRCSTGFWARRQRRLRAKWRLCGANPVPAHARAGCIDGPVQAWRSEPWSYGLRSSRVG
jgi:pimeloyl-ACP methyl ester carboxylesterase